MAEHAELAAETRELLGKKVRRLRREGILPATIYGYNVQPQSIQLKAHEFAGVLKSSGRTQLIDLVIDGKRARPVFVKQTTVNAKRNMIEHVEFYQANLTQKMHASVQLQFEGESQAVREGGIFLPVLDHVEIEALPDAVPHDIPVDISVIAEINGQIHASELEMPEGVVLITPGDEIICKVNPPVAEEVVEEAVEATEPLPEELGGEETPPEAVPEA